MNNKKRPPVDCQTYLLSSTLTFQLPDSLQKHNYLCLCSQTDLKEKPVGQSVTVNINPEAQQQRLHALYLD